MNKRTSMLDAVRNSNNKIDQKSTKYKQLLVVKEVLLRYFNVYDLDNGTIHSKVFSMLYFSQTFYTYRAICETLHISKSTLIRYIEKYDELAIKVIEHLNI